MPLYVIATPIGNSADLSPRALTILKSAKLILAEDTKKTRNLLIAFGIAPRDKNIIQRCDSYEEKRLCESKKFTELLKSDVPIALVSDAGTPTISDPGTVIVALAHQLGVPTIPVPGPSALIAALSVSSFHSSSFAFGGYLPSNSSDRKKVIKQYRVNKNCVVFYETPHRIQATLDELCELWGAERQAMLARELTKDYETLYRGSLQDIKQNLVADEQRGEMVLVLDGLKSAEKDVGADSLSGEKSEQLTEQDKYMLTLLLEHLPLKTASGVAAQISGKSKKIFYEGGLGLKQK